MNKEARAQEIIERFGGAGEGYYRHEEVLAEYNRVVETMADVVFGDRQEELCRHTVQDVAKRLKERAGECGMTGCESFHRIKKDLMELDNRIQAEQAGRWGENLAFQKLEAMSGPYKLIRNVELDGEKGRTEIDGIVLTRKAIFILEIKNTKRDVYIDEKGCYTTLGTHETDEGNIRWKMHYRYVCLKECLKKMSVPYLKIVQLVVFTNETSKLTNRCDKVNAVYLSQLQKTMESYMGRELYSDLDVSNMARYIEQARGTTAYPIAFAITNLKMDFAQFIAELEEAEEITRKDIAMEKLLELVATSTFGVGILNLLSRSA